MISGIVIIILIVIGVFAIKLNHLKHRFFIIALVLLALFLYSSMSLVTTQNELDITSVGGALSSMKIYAGWLANGFNNMKDLTGRAIDQDWANSNATFFEEEE